MQFEKNPIISGQRKRDLTFFEGSYQKGKRGRARAYRKKELKIGLKALRRLVRRILERRRFVLPEKEG